MYTMLDFIVVLNAQRFIVGANPELFRTTDEAASRDISFLPTPFKSPHSLHPMREHDTAYFQSHATDVFITPCLSPCFVEGC